jgi:hypothetical protein
VPWRGSVFGITLSNMIYSGSMSVNSVCGVIVNGSIIQYLVSMINSRTSNQKKGRGDLY